MASSRPHQSHTASQPDTGGASRQRHDDSQQTSIFFPATDSSCHAGLSAASHRHSSSHTGLRPIGDSRRSALSCALVAFVVLAGFFLHPVQAQPAAPSQLTVTQVTDISASITWTSVAGAEAYRIQRSRYAPGPYTTFKEYYAPPFTPAPNVVTLTGLIEGDLYFLRVLSGTADGQFETAGSPVAVAIPILGVRTGVNSGPPATSPLLEAYDETFCRISWVRPGSGVTQTGPAASHFAVGYRCGNSSVPTIYPEEFTSTTATLNTPFVMGVSCQFYVISRNLNYNPADPWSRASESFGKNKWNEESAFTVLYPQPSRVTNLVVTAATLDSVTLQFAASPNAIAYQTSYAPVEPDGALGNTVLATTGVGSLDVTITGLTSRQLYRFSIQAANKHAAGYGAAATIDVAVEGQPARPQLRIDSVQSTSLVLSWTPPPSTHPLKYFIYYVQGATTSSESMTDLTSVTLSSLTQGQPVLIFVRARNLLDYGPYANITATPILTPVGLTQQINLTLVEGSRERAIEVSFLPVAFSDRYQIQISAGGDAFLDRGDVFFTTKGIITGLLAKTPYSFKIFAGNLAGFDNIGKTSSTITTDEIPQPEASPSNFRVLGVTVSSILFAWDLPAADKKVTHFRVEKDPTGNFGVALPPEGILLNQGLDDPTWSPTYNVTGLTLGVNYYFAVTSRSANSSGFLGVPRTKIQTTTTTQPTAAVENLMVVKIFPSSALLSFTAVPAQSVTRYRIDGTTVRDGVTVPIPPSEVDHFAEGGTMEYTVTGLDTVSVYSFSVTARNYNIQGFDGVPAATINGVRLMGVPNSVINLRVAAITSDSIALAWDKSLVTPIASVFKITYRIGALAFASQGIPELTATTYTVTGLQRGVLYDFKIFAGTLAGYESDGSNLVSAAPVSRPKEVDALIIREIALNYISLRWEPATFPRATSFLLKYLGKEIETTQLDYVATGMRPGEPVTFSIFARNFNALGYETKGQTVVVTPIGPPGLVTTLKIVGVTTTSVTIDFDPIELVNVTKIKVQVKRAIAENWTEFAEYQCRIDEQYLNDAPTCSTRIQIDNLVLGVLYYVRVLQRNSNSVGYLEGGKILTISPTLKPTRSVNNLQVVGVTTSAVFFEFERPTGVDAPTHYKIVYSMATGGGPEIVTDEFPTAQQTLNVTGLIKDVVYRFQIIGRNLNLDGYTNAVRSVVVSTAPFEKPSKVTNIANPGVGADEITITWDPPLRGPVSLYKIEIANATTMMNGVRIDVAELGLAPAYREVGTTPDRTFSFKATKAIPIEVDVKLILRVSARNINIDGYGEPAEILAIPTAEPKNRPRDFTVESVTKESVFLSWMPPEGYVLGDGTITRYLLEGCAENCGSSDPFPAAPTQNAKWYVMGGSEYEWRGFEWKFTGKTFWRTIAVLPYTQIAYDVTNIGEYKLIADQEYEFRVSAGNKNTLATGPFQMISKVKPLYPPGPARKVVISNPKITEFALNFVPPLVTNITGIADRHRILVTDMVTGKTYEYHTLIPLTSAIVTGFNPSTEYYLTVHSGNLAGFDPIGARSSSTITTRGTPCSKDCCEQVKGCNLCCGLMARRIQNDAVELIWDPPSNLEFMHYKIKYQEYAAALLEAGIGYSNRFTVTGLDFAGVANYRFFVIGGSRIQNTFDLDSLAGDILVTSKQSTILEVKLEVFYVSSTTVTLSWTRPYQPFSVYEIKYAIQVTLDSFDENALNNTRWIQAIPDPNKGRYTTLEVTGLETETFYNFRVLAKTPYSPAYKDGVCSNTIRAKPTLQARPVQNLMVALVTLDGIYISWQNLLPGNEITHLKVTWYGKNNNGTEEFESDDKVFIDGIFNISRLVANERYVFRVQAKNFNIRGYEAGVTVTGIPQTTPPPPLNPRLVQFYANGVELQWEANPILPSALRYQIQCRVQEDPAGDYRLRAFANCVSGPASSGAPFIKALEVDAPSTFTLIEGIGEGYTYQFRVCAVGSNFQGAIESTCSDYLAVTPSPPPLPSTLAIGSVTVSSITLSWTPDAGNAESWSFIPGKDQPLFDISCPGGSVDALKAACNAKGGCVGYSTTGCLKSNLGLESSWISYASTSFAQGECCISNGVPSGCSAAGVDLSPKPSCGCRCKGMWRKNLQYLLQMSKPPGPFANVQIGPIAGTFGTRISKPTTCASCSECPSSCVAVSGLQLNIEYQFRLYTRNLNGVGYSGESSNLVSAIPSAQPITAVTDLRLLYTSESRAQLVWTGITAEPVVQYRVLASFDGVTWDPPPPLAVLDLVDHQAGENRGGAGLLDIGTKYWLKVQARNLNSLGYEGVPSSNVVTAVPFTVIDRVGDLRATASTTCTDIFCCECCKANLCRGVGQITLTWKAPPGPITSYRVEVAEWSKTGVVGAFTLKQNVVPALTTTNVTGLLVGTDYVFKVVGVSTFVTPFLPDCTVLSTADQVCPSLTYASPYTLPATSVESTLRVVSVTNGTITVEWQPITSEPVTRYQVSYGKSILKPNEYPFAEIDHLNGTLRSSIGAINGPPETRLTAGLLQEKQFYFIYVIPRNLNTGGYASCPKTAENIVANDLGDGSFSLFWTAPAHTLSIMSYRIWYHPNGTSEVLTYAGRYQLLTPISVLEYTVRGLTAGSVYQFYVIPSASPCAMIGPVTTTNRPNQVQNFVPSQSSESSVRFVWSLSEASDGYSLAQAYVVSFAQHTNGHSCETHNYTEHSKMSATQTAYTFTGLRTMQKYCFRIYAENYHDQVSGPASYAQAQPMGLPYAPPTNLALVSRNNVPGVDKGASILLKWVKPTIDRYFFPTAAEILHYKVAYWKQSDITCLQKLVHINCKTYKEHPQTFLTTFGNVTGLDPSETYNFKVYSGNPNGYDPDGSLPLGPVFTSNLPGPVLNLHTPSVTATSVTLLWTMPSNPSPSKLKLAHREHMTGREVVEERSCVPPASACPSTKEWTGLTNSYVYTFTVYTGGPDDSLIPISFKEAYTGVASFVASPYMATNSPRNLTMISWSDTGVRLKFLEPAPDPLNGPVLDYFLEGKIGGGGSWTYTSVGKRLSPLTAGQELAIESIGGTVLNFQDKYSFRVYTRNLFGNSTSAMLENITITPRPSMVPTLERTPATAEQTAPVYNLQWGTPLVGASEGIGFQYVLEVSDDMGATFHTDIKSPFALGSSQTVINFVNRPRPMKIENGKVYLTRIRPKNMNAGALITSVPAKTLITYTAVPPGPVAAIDMQYVTATHAAVKWHAPPDNLAQLSFSEDYDVYYDCQVAVFSLQPEFHPLNETFANIQQTGIAFSLTEVRAALTRAGATVAATDSRFLMRVIPRNRAGVSSTKNPSTEVWFVDRPAGKLENLQVVSVRNGSVDIRWMFPNTTVGLVGFDIRTSADGLAFSRNKIVPSTYTDANGKDLRSTSTTVSGLPVGKNWIQILEISESDASIGYSLLGPTLIDSSLESVFRLEGVSVTADSVLLRWDMSPTSLLGWEVSYTSGDSTATVGPISVSTPSYSVTGLDTDVVYKFFVSARSESGLGLPSTVYMTTMKVSLPVHSLKVIPFDASGNLRIAWLEAPSNHKTNFKVLLAEENQDGNIGILRTGSDSSTEKMRTITGLAANQGYRFVVESANMHERGFGSPVAIQFTVPQKPNVPSSVLLAFSLNNGLIVKWIAPTTGAAVTYFKIVTVSPENEQVLQYHNAATLMAEIQSLQPCTLYSITVSSCNIAGCTDAASLTNKRTAPSQPLALTTSIINATSVTLGWNHPAPTNLAYVYRIKYRKVTTVPPDTSVIDGRLVAQGGGGFVPIFKGWSVESLSNSSGAGTTKSLTELKGNRKYQVAIYAEFSGIRADPVFIMVMPAETPQAVQEFKIADDAHNGVLQNSLTIMWRAPAGSTLTHYDLYYWSTADPNNKNFTKIGVFEANEKLDGSGDNFYTITGLKTFQRYGFEIITRNLNTDGNANTATMRDCSGQVNTLCTTTLPIPVYQPGRVQNLRMTATTFDSVTLKWDLPPSPDPQFVLNIHYEVSYTTVASNSFIAFRTITDGSTTIIIPSLSNAGSGVAYYFRIKARNGNSQGYGPGKVITGMPNMVCVTSACLVRNLAVIAYSGRTGQTGSVTISWSPPVEVDSNPYLRFYYLLSSGGTNLGPELPPEDNYFTFNGTQIDERKDFNVVARTLTPTGSSNSGGNGGTMTISAIPKIQPAALTSAPSLVAVSSTSVTLQWTGYSSHGNEYSYKVGWRLAGTKDGFLNPTYSATTQAVVTGLLYSNTYEFKVFSRNLNSDGFEGFGSPQFTASPRRTLSPPPNFKIAAVTDTSITMSWEAHPGVSNARYILTIGNAEYDHANSTLVDGTDVFTATKTALALGNVYYFSLKVFDLGDWSEIGFRKARTITKASAVHSLQAFAIDADDSGLSWEPPLYLGSPSQGLSTGSYTIDVLVGSSWVNLGTSDSLRFNHANITQRGVTYRYRVAALIVQSEEFGYMLNPGAYAEVTLFFGTAPIFVGATPPDQKTIIAQQAGIVYIPLYAYSPDVPPNQISFRCTGALPSVATLTPTVPIANATSGIAFQNLAVEFVPDLAGSQFYLCMQAQDSNGLRTQARCYTILLPLPTPRWLAPSHESAYEARVGCTLAVGIVVEDRTSSDIDPAFAAEGGFIPQVVLLTITTESSYRSSVTMALPAGASLVTAATGVQNPSTTNLVWRLRKGQEGFAYRLCFSTLSANNDENQLCMSVTTFRCQYCTQSDDSLQRVAKEWHTTWSQVWSGNHILNNPDLLFTQQIVQVGPIYSVQRDEDLDHIALRYGVDLRDLLLWNPDVADTAAQQQHYVIRELQELCVVPQSCIYAGGISSSPTISHAAL